MGKAHNHMVEGWGRVPSQMHTSIHYPQWEHTAVSILKSSGSILGIGNLRSYGDSCLNQDGELLSTKFLNRFIDFDEETGLVTCESGVLLSDILHYFVPRGWFLKVTPGTKFITVGGAIANDVHGKNHHANGTFGMHLKEFTLARSSGELVCCSPLENTELFNATIGGLGLTGVILRVSFYMQRIVSPLYNQTTIKFSNIDEYFDVAEENDSQYQAVASWIDLTSKGKSLGRGIYIAGNLSNEPDAKTSTSGTLLTIPVDAPSALLNKASIKAFNTLYFNKQQSKIAKSVVHYEPFYYPLDTIASWNKLYGKSGFFQHQCAIPKSAARQGIRTLLTKISAFGSASFLSVLKNFGSMQSPGVLSFPIEGTTLAMDFKNQGTETLHLLNELDAIVKDYGGRIYPAKDARMSPHMFEHSFPHWKQLLPYVDEHCSSSFWRRVTGTTPT